jgi:hypothetical protein
MDAGLGGIVRLLACALLLRHPSGHGMTILVAGRLTGTDEMFRQLGTGVLVNSNQRDNPVPSSRGRPFFSLREREGAACSPETRNFQKHN